MDEVRNKIVPERPVMVVCMLTESQNLAHDRLITKYQSGCCVCIKEVELTLTLHLPKLLELCKSNGSPMNIHVHLYMYVHWFYFKFLRNFKLKKSNFVLRH